ncbi:hypothetical protein EDC94DRAFT_591774, partial [Helicostylum pulchrum]
IFGKDLVKLKGLRCGVVGILSIDGFKAARICNKRSADSLNPAKNVKGQSVLVCKNCNTLWQRDVNASKNILSISLSIWKGDG